MLPNIPCYSVTVYTVLPCSPTTVFCLFTNSRHKMCNIFASDGPEDNSTFGRVQGVQMCYKSHLRFPVGNSLHASRRRTVFAAEVAKSHQKSNKFYSTSTSKNGAIIRVNQNPEMIKTSKMLRKIHLKKHGFRAEKYSRKYENLMM